MKDKRMVGIGGAPTRCTTLPEGAEERKKFPVASGFMDYFPDAIVAVSKISYLGNEQHNPGQPLNWNRSKSADESDTIMRHFLQRGTFDTDGSRHTAKLVWRALALLQKEIEADQGALDKSRGCPPAQIVRNVIMRNENPCGCAPAFEVSNPNRVISKLSIADLSKPLLGTCASSVFAGSAPHKRKPYCVDWKPLEK